MSSVPRPITAPVIHNHGPSLTKAIVVGFASTFINAGVLGLMFVLSLLLGLGVAAEGGEPQPEMEQKSEVEDPPKEFDLTNTDLGTDDSVPLNYDVDRIEDVSVPGKVDPTANVGIENAPVANPMNVPAPMGTGQGTGGSPIDITGTGTGNAFGAIGGMGGIGTGGGFGGRSGGTRVKMVQEGGGNARSEKAVADGLRWIVLHQASDGHWSLHNFPKYARTEPLPAGKVLADNSTPMTTRNNDTAGTAFGLLPLLAAGITHKPPVKWKGWLRKEYISNNLKVANGIEVEVLNETAENEYKVRIKLPKDSKPATVDVVLNSDAVLVQPNYNRSVAAGVRWMIAKQSKSGNDKGYYGGDMYSHGLATIAMCEAYGLTSDPTLKLSAQMGIDYIIRAQHEGGGWRYAPKQAGDTSVVGWQLMALKSGQMSGLSVPKKVLTQVGVYLNSVQPREDWDDKFAERNKKEPTGMYGYADNRGGSPAMSAVGGLCRQYLGVNPRNPSLLATVNRIKAVPPKANAGIYYEYYATQVMHHMGGETWDIWNLGPKGTGEGGIRDVLIARQDQSGANKGSFAGSDHGSGGRLGATALSLLTLEVYYRHLPLYRRDAGMAKPDDK